MRVKERFNKAQELLDTHTIASNSVANYPSEVCMGAPGEGCRFILLITASPGHAASCRDCLHKDHNLSLEVHSQPK